MKQQIKLGNAELKVMNIIWENGDIPAKTVAAEITKKYGWTKNATYTLIKRCIAKGAIERIEPQFICHALITREEIEEQSTEALIQNIYCGNEDKLFAALLGRKKLSQDKIDKLRKIIDEN